MTLPTRIFAFCAAAATAFAVAPAHADTGARGSAEAASDTVMRDNRPPVYRPVNPQTRPVRVPARRAPSRVYAVPAHAPRPRMAIEPFFMPDAFFSLGIQGTSILGADNSRMTAGLGTGAGFELGFGWRLSEELSLDFNFAMSFHDSLVDQRFGQRDPGAMLGHFGLDFRYFLGDWTRALQPYLQVGVGGYFLGRDTWDFDTLGGFGMQLGAGFDYYIARTVSIGAKALYRGAYLDNSGSTWSGFATESMWLSAFTFGGDIKFHF